MKRQAGGGARSGGPAAATVAAREFGRLEGVARDLRESPFPLELDLSRVFRTARTPWRRRSPTATRRWASCGWASCSRRGSTRGCARWRRARPPHQRRSGRTSATRATSSATSTGAACGWPRSTWRRNSPPRRPCWPRRRRGRIRSRTGRGSLERHYLLEDAGEITPDHVYVPELPPGDSHAPRRRPPRPGRKRGRVLRQLRGPADQACRAARVPDGRCAGVPDRTASTARRLAAPQTSPPPAPWTELSEKDVLETVRLMRGHYNVDPNRLAPDGHSMGAIGTWHLAAKYPEMWAALGPFAGTGNPATVARMKGVPQVVVHGDADATVNVEGSRAMVAEMKRLGGGGRLRRGAGGQPYRRRGAQSPEGVRIPRRAPEGRRAGAAVAPSGAAARLQALDLLADQPFGDGRDDLGDPDPEGRLRQGPAHAVSHPVDERLVDRRARQDNPGRHTGSPRRAGVGTVLALGIEQRANASGTPTTAAAAASRSSTGKDGASAPDGSTAGVSGRRAA